MYDDAQLSDDALMARYAHGDMDAARCLARRHSARVMCLAFRMLGDHASAEDIVQETMLRLWRVAQDWQPGKAKLSTWLYRVCSNLCIDQLRKYRRLDIDAIDVLADGTLSSEQKMQTQACHDSLYAALAELPDRQRLAVTLRHIEGLANPEIAQIMGVSVDAIESLTARGKRRLCEILEPLRDQIGYE